MFKTISSKCPNCYLSNSFNVPIALKKVSDIDVPWFQCSFCFKRINKKLWL